MKKLENVKFVKKHMTSEESGEVFDYYRVILKVTEKTSLELKPIDKKAFELLVDFGLIEFEDEVSEVE